MGKTLSKTNCCAPDQFSSNLTISAEVERFGSFKDDEPILENLSFDASIDYHPPTIALKLVCNYIQSSNSVQEWPAALSVSCEESNIDLRSGIDIVCVFELSHFTKGKEKLLKNSIEFIMSRLTGQDRLSLVSFSDSSKRLSPLTSMTYTGKVRINIILQSLHSTGGADLTDGLTQGFSVLCNRRNLNHQSFIILFASGEDSHSQSIEERLTCLFQECLGKDLSTVFVFALDRPNKVLNFVAEETNGICYFAKDDNEWFKNLAFSSGIMESKVVSEIFVKLEVVECGVPVTISKVYSENGGNEFRVQDGLAGCEINVVFLLKVFEFSEDVMKSVVTASVQYCFCGVKYKTEVEMKVQFFKASENVAEIELDEEVLKSFYRVKVADIMNEAAELALRDKDEAKLLLLRGAAELQESCISQTPLVQSLRQELLTSMQQIEKTEESATLLRCRARNHWAKRVSSYTEYQNSATQANIYRLRTIFNII